MVCWGETTYLLKWTGYTWIESLLWIPLIKDEMKLPSSHMVWSFFTPVTLPYKEDLNISLTITESYDSGLLPELGDISDNGSWQIHIIKADEIEQKRHQLCSENSLVCLLLLNLESNEDMYKPRCPISLKQTFETYMGHDISESIDYTKASALI